MKRITSLLLAAALGLSLLSARAQLTPSPENTISNLVANVPQAATFADAKLELSIGTVMHGTASFENSVGLRYNITQSFFVGAEVQNGPASTVIDSAAAFFGVRKAFDNAEIYAQAGARRSWITAADGRPAWEFLVGGGAAWRPVQSGFLSKAAVFAEAFFVGSQNNRRPSEETHAGVTFIF